MPTTSPRHLRVYACATQKGGVGKTTSAINISFEFAQQGLRVLAIDLDPQRNMTNGFGVDVSDDDGTVYEVLTPERGDRMALADVIKTTEFGVDVVPTVKDLIKLERSGLGPGGEARLRAAIATVESQYDVVVIDCPPALGPLSVSAFTAADDVIAIVSPQGPDELAGLVDLDDTILDVQEIANPDVAIRHVLLANYLGGNSLAKEIRAALRRDWPEEFLGCISRTVKVGEAKARQVPIALHAADCTAAQDYRDVTKLIIERMGA